MLKKLLRWWKLNHSMFIRCDAEHSTIMLSKKLFTSIMNDHPDETHISVLFAKTQTNGTSVCAPRTYVMFFNPEWDKHGVDNPRSIQTIPVTIGKFGHVGFQSVQPSVKELGIMYGHSEDEFDIGVTKSRINGEPYYILIR